MGRGRLLLLSLVALLTAAAVVALLMLRPWAGRAPEQAAPTPPSDTLGAWIEIFFTTPRPRGEPSPSGSPGRLDERLTASIDGATRTIDMAIYDLALDNVASALLRAKQRGVRVRIVAETDNENTAAMKRVRDGGIPVVADGRGPFMHHKFTVLDGETVWMGSWNYTPYQTFRDNNNAALIRSHELAQNYTTEFEKMFVGRQFGPTKPKGTPHPRITIDGATIETIFESEDDAPPRIIERIRSARQSVAFLAFSFTHDDIGMAMEERSRAGVAVRGVVETSGSDRPESEYGRLRRAGLDAAQPAGVPAAGCAAGPGVLPDGSSYLMHHKVIVIDARTVIFGSFNFSQNAARDNDENLLIVDDPAVARRFLEEFCRVYNLAADKAATKKP